jgi:beta-phosphoglucomutase
MKYQGAIFDFNGTLFWDTPYHNQAWDIFLQKHRIRLTDDEKNQKIHGKNNRDIFRVLFGRKPDEAEMQKFIFEKEAFYQEICLANTMELASGVTELFDFLKTNDIRFTIATSCGIENIIFYFQHFQLEKWFDMDRIVFNDGKVKGKPNPDLFIKAMEILGTTPETTVIFEDSEAGITAAQNAGAGKIVIVNSIEEDYRHWPYPVITDFDEVDRGWFG